MEDAIMSTRNELYHCFGLGVVEVSRTEFGGGETVFYCQTPASRLRCACCYGTDVICRVPKRRELLKADPGTDC